MKKTIPKKIHLIGSVGSGKTTLAQEISSRLDIPHYELDNVVRLRRKTGDIKRTDQEREVYLNSIIHSDNWIIEGVHFGDWVDNCFHHADLIVFLDTNYSIRIHRIIKRFLKQKLRLEKSNYKPKWSMLFKMLKWNRDFEKVSKVKFFKEFGQYKDKIIVINNTKFIEEYLS